MSGKLDRIEPRLGRSTGQSYAGYMRAKGALAPLPIGSSLNAATALFTWQPGVGFVGSYDLVFVRWANGRAVAKQEGAKDGVVSNGFVVAGWAADLDSVVDAGVDSVQVWAYPAGGADAVFAYSTVQGRFVPAKTVRVTVK